MSKRLGNSLLEHMRVHFHYTNKPAADLEDHFIQSFVGTFTTAAYGKGDGPVRNYAQKVLDQYQGRPFFTLSPTDIIKRDVAQEVLEFLDMPVARGTTPQL